LVLLETLLADHYKLMNAVFALNARYARVLSRDNAKSMLWLTVIP
jgi:hypothetical protein